ncbi:hypothetical protein ACFYZ2_03505 [Streptomyces sviceus]|uniref:hypothetical protein n=1 Tax=Streptomyces sviceus TaxID=285530 RepID=UPI0036C7F535
MILSLKISLGSDTRCTQFLCPSLADSSGISRSKTKCPYTPPEPDDPASERRAGRGAGSRRCLDVPNPSHVDTTTPAMFQPLRLAELERQNRVIGLAYSVEVTDVWDGEVQVLTAGADLLELGNVRLREPVGGGHDPAHHVSGCGW